MPQIIMTSTVNAVITTADSTTVSAAVDLLGGELVGIQMPATFTGTALTFQISADNSTFQVLYNDAGTAYSVTVAQAHYIAIDHTKFYGVRFLKVVSGSAEGGNRTLQLVVRPTL